MAYVKITRQFGAAYASAANATIRAMKGYSPTIEFEYTGGPSKNQHYVTGKIQYGDLGLRGPSSVGTLSATDDPAANGDSANADNNKPEDMDGDVVKD